jgi:hypothetical protein
MSARTSAWVASILVSRSGSVAGPGDEPGRDGGGDDADRGDADQHERRSPGVEVVATECAKIA